MPYPARSKAVFHLPGLFEFYDLYRLFLPLFYEHNEYFFDYCEIGSLYGAPADCLWGGGRVGFGEATVTEALALTDEYGISPRLTLSNSLLRPEHLQDCRCNALCEAFAARSKVPCGIILHSDLLLRHLQAHFPSFYYVSSTTKVLDDFALLKGELNRPEFRYVVPDFRLNRALPQLLDLPAAQREKLEMLCNECCSPSCLSRRACYENVSRKNLGEPVADHRCTAPNAARGYRFSDAMQSPLFIGPADITDTYLPMGITQFKLEGRSLGSAMVLEILLHYLARPEYHVKLREEIYLDSMLDLF